MKGARNGSSSACAPAFGVLLSALVVGQGALLAGEPASRASQTESAGAPDAKGESAPRLVRVTKIWDAAPHCAFTDLVRFDDRFICVFREGAKHVSPDGALRVIESREGREWSSVARIADPRADLRDAKIAITPEGELLLGGAAAFEGARLDSGEPLRHRSRVWRSRDGRSWSEGVDAGDPNFWIWRVSFPPRGAALAIGYQTHGGTALRLYHSDDGVRYETLVGDLGVEGVGNESSILFVEEADANAADGKSVDAEGATRKPTALCLLRRDPEPGLLGRAQPPYTEWTWKELGARIGGPHWIRLPDGRFLAAVRLYDAPVRTALAWIDVEKGTLTECLALPSGGDTSYAGLVWHEGRLWVSYYSSHEARTAIYLAEVEIPNAESPPVDSPPSKGE